MMVSKSRIQVCPHSQDKTACISHCLFDLVLQGKSGTRKTEQEIKVVEENRDKTETSQELNDNDDDDDDDDDDGDDSYSSYHALFLCTALYIHTQW